MYDMGVGILSRRNAPGPNQYEVGKFPSFWWMPPSCDGRLVQAKQGVVSVRLQLLKNFTVYTMYLTNINVLN